jgi:hypothetical protein
VRSHARAFAVPDAGAAVSRLRQSLFGAACLCVLALTAFLGTGAPSAGAADLACPNEEFRTGLGAELPRCRAYEQVSPPDKNGAKVWDPAVATQTGILPVSLDGEVAEFSAVGTFAGQDWGPGLSTSLYYSQRIEGNWRTSPILPRPLVPAEANASMLFSSIDLTRMAFRTGSPSGPAGEAQAYGYVRDRLAGTLDLTWEGSANSFDIVTGNPAMDAIVFASADVQTDDPGIPIGISSLYEYRDGEIRLVSVRDDGTPFQTVSYPGGANSIGGVSGSAAGAVSDDARHVFFTNVDENGVAEIYRRSDGAVTIPVSPSQRTPIDPLGTRSKNFYFATGDGNRVFFTSREQLTDDANTGPARAGADLYRYDIAEDELIDISVLPDGDGARVQGVLAVDESGQRVYYAAGGLMVPGQGVDGAANVYLWEDDGTADGTTRYVTTVDPRVDIFEPGDSANWETWSPYKKTSQATADGSYLLLESGREIPGFQTGGARHLYRYAAEGNGGAGSLTCVSCKPGGGAQAGVAVTKTADHTSQNWEAPRSLAADGAVFFTSKDALVPKDSNGEADAYEWNGGTRALLSTGTHRRGSYFYGASADGEDVFLVTAEALVPQDGDEVLDLYDARVGGGLAAQFASPPPTCQGEDCRPPGPAPVPAPAAASKLFQGRGNVAAPRRRCPKGKRLVRRKGARKARCAKVRKGTGRARRAANADWRKSR